MKQKEYSFTFINTKHNAYFCLYCTFVNMKSTIYQRECGTMLKIFAVAVP